MIIHDRKQLNWMIGIIVASLGYFGVKGGVFAILTGGAYHVWGPDGTSIGGSNDLTLALVMTIPLSVIYFCKQSGDGLDVIIN